MSCSLSQVILKISVWEIEVVEIGGQREIICFVDILRRSQIV